jgi:hypothetical protein
MSTYADALYAWVDAYTYDLAAAAANPSGYSWWDAANSRALLQQNPTKATVSRGPARGYVLLADGTLTVLTITGDQRTFAHTAGNGLGIQITAILASSAPVLVGW